MTDLVAPTTTDCRRSKSSAPQFILCGSSNTSNSRLVDELVARSVKNLNLNAAGSGTDVI